MPRVRATGVLLLCLAVASSRAPRTRWRNVIPHAEWEPGYSFAAIGIRDTLWLFGHRKGTWYAAGGSHWLDAAGPPAAAGGYNAYVLHNGAVYAIGGAEDQNHPTRHGVWKSADGRAWQLVTDAPAWSPRVWHTATAHDGRSWLIGGWETDFNDVWSSANGVSWSRATNGAGWSKRYGMAAVAWGGTRLFRSNDVWSSTDGATWVAHGAAGWSPRFALASAVFRDRVWVLGGKESGGRFTNDVWYLDTLTR